MDVDPGINVPEAPPQEDVAGPDSTRPSTLWGLTPTSPEYSPASSDRQGRASTIHYARSPTNILRDQQATDDAEKLAATYVKPKPLRTYLQPAPSTSYGEPQQLRPQLTNDNEDQEQPLNFAQPKARRGYVQPQPRKGYAQPQLAPRYEQEQFPITYAGPQLPVPAIYSQSGGLSQVSVSHSGASPGPSQRPTSNFPQQPLRFPRPQQPVAMYATPPLLMGSQHISTGYAMPLPSTRQAPSLMYTQTMPLCVYTQPQPGSDYAIPRHLLPSPPYAQHLPITATTIGYARPQQPIRPYYTQTQPLPRSMRPHTPVVRSSQPDGSGSLRDFRTQRLPKIAPRRHPYVTPNKQHTFGGGSNLRERQVPDSPYYRPEKPWLRQKWLDEPDTPLNRHMDKVLGEKLFEHMTKINARNQNQEQGQAQNEAQARAQTNLEQLPDSPSAICKWWLCELCLEIPVQPITTTCGHTLCRRCAERAGICRCGIPVPDPLVPNCIISSLMETLAPQNPEQRARVGYTDLAALELQRLATPPQPELQPSTSSGRTTRRGRAHRTGVESRPGGSTLEPQPSTSSGRTSRRGHAHLTGGGGRPYHPVGRHTESDSSCDDSDSRHSTTTCGSHQYFPTGAESPIIFPMGHPTWPLDCSPAPTPSPQDMQFRTASDLVASGCDAQAVPYLSDTIHFGIQPLATFAADLMIVVIKKLRDSPMIRNLCGLILSSDAKRVCLRGDLECVLCTQVFKQPVTTPCGHTYCRDCLEHCIDYSRACPLCSASIADFNIDTVLNTIFLEKLIEIADLPREDPPTEPDDRIPVFVCTVAYPKVPCPLFVFEPRYRCMLRRCLRDGTRRFGIAAAVHPTGFVDYGTILEVRDSVRLRDGRYIVSAVGVSRFRVLEKGMRDGYDVARVEPIQDIKPEDITDSSNIKQNNQHLRRRAEAWLRTMTPAARAEIDLAFGPMPSCETNIFAPDGPDWLWWVLAILPLDESLKVVILSDPDLRKRMAVVERTMEIMYMFAKQPADRRPLIRRNGQTNPPRQVIQTPRIVASRLQRAA